MKTAISIPDEVFAEAEELAKALKVSRSRLYSRAVREYVARHGTEQVTAALDALFATDDEAGATVAGGKRRVAAGKDKVRVAPDGFAAAAARRTLQDTEW
jgi:predicted transcriptional regulator